MTYDYWRRAWFEQAISALRDLKSAAAFEPLLDLAQTANLPPKLRDAAFAALSEIAPASTADPAELAEWRSSHEDAMRLQKVLERGPATLDAIMAGLEHRESVKLAARRLSENKTLIVQALPSLLRSLEMFDDSDAVACLKWVPMSNLLERVALHQTEALGYVGRRLLFERNVPANVRPLFEEQLDYLDCADAKVADLYDGIENTLVQLEVTQNRLPSRSDGVLFAFQIREVQRFLTMLAAQNPDWQSRLAPALAYIQGKLVARKAICQTLLGEALQDADLRAEFLGNEKAKEILPFLSLDLTAGN